MSDQSETTPTARSGRRDYQWTPARICLGGAIVAIAGFFIGYFVRNELLAIREGVNADRAYERLHRLAVREQSADFNLDNLRVDSEDIRFGGPQKDGIPALTDPEMVPVREASHLRDDDRVVGVEIGDRVAAYPIRALTYHEAVNDVIGGTPVLIVYCPLCDSVSVVDRRVDGAVHEFGISGLLYNSNVLLYDRTDDSLWSQLGFEAISGQNAGRALAHFGWTLTSFGQFRAEHPDAAVMTFNTGYKRDYERQPYDQDYFVTDQLIFPVNRRDGRLGTKVPVVGVRVGESARAYPVGTIRESPGGIVRDTVGGGEVVLHADAASGLIRVERTPDGAHVAHTFWFSWAAFHPGTEIYGE